MKMLAAALVLLLLSFGAVQSAAADDEPYYVELAVFTCPHCRDANAYVNQMERRFGDHFVFAPLPFEGGSNMGARAYYALRDSVDDDNLRNAIFAFFEQMHMQATGIDEIIEFLRLRGIDFNVEDTKRAAFGKNVDDSMNRAIRLAKRSGATTVPAIVETSRQGEIIKTFERKKGENAQEFVQRVIRSND